MELQHCLCSLAAERAYIDFVASHGEPVRDKPITAYFGSQSSATRTTYDAFWPEFDHSVYRVEHRPPKLDGINSLFWTGFNLIKDHMLRDLASQLPGRIMSWDGTFELAKKTMGDLLCDDDQNALALVHGEYGHILFYGFVPSESPIYWQRMMYFIRKRCERAGNHHVQEVEFGWSDLCCENCHDRTKHWYTKMLGRKKKGRRDGLHSTTTEDRAESGHDFFQLFPSPSPFFSPSPG
jgi:hypothetical protein